MRSVRLGLLFGSFRKPTFLLAFFGRQGFLHQLNGLFHPFAAGCKNAEIFFNSIRGHPDGLGDLDGALSQRSRIVSLQFALGRLEQCQQANGHQARIVGLFGKAEILNPAVEVVVGLL